MRKTPTHSWGFLLLKPELGRGIGISAIGEIC